MARISIDTNGVSGAEGLISDEQFKVIGEGCLETLRLLGPLARWVETIRVTFDRIGSDEMSGPIFTIYYKNLVKKKDGWYQTDYRSMGGTNPSAKDIVAGLMGEGQLPRLLQEHARRCEENLEVLKAMLAGLKGD